MDEDFVQERSFDKGCTRYQSRDKGQIIHSKRKFGIEVEMFHPKQASVAELSRNVNKAFGFEHDGSIEARGNKCIEVVSPILQGRLGETEVKNLFLEINKLGFKVNKTCGLHVHLDGKDFSSNDKINIIPYELIDEKALDSVDKNCNSFIVQRDVVKVISKRSGIPVEDVARLLMDEYKTTQNRSIFLSKTLGTYIPEIRVEPVCIEVGKRCVLLDMFCIGSNIPFSTINSMKIEKVVPSKEDYFAIIYNNNNLQNVLTLLYLHTVFGDVFMSMLPKSRRQDNLYCQQLSLGFSAGQIEQIGSFTELENAWYRTRTQNEAREKKGNRYDDSRYFSVNLHSLFAKYGTIEMRSHSATLDPNKVLYWVAFNQEILDNIVSGAITIKKLSDGAHLFNLTDKTNFLFHSLGLRAPLVEYMKQRIEYFKNNEK